MVVTWKLHANNGGHPVTAVLIYWKKVGESWADGSHVEVDVRKEEIGMYTIETLSPNTKYQLRVVARNMIGPSEAIESDQFQTPPPGYPGSPSQVQIKNVTDTSVVVCWMTSEVGRPFTSYTITGAQVNDSSSPGKFWEPNAKNVEQLPGGSESVMVCWYIVHVWKLKCSLLLYLLLLRLQDLSQIPATNSQWLSTMIKAVANLAHPQPSTVPGNPDLVSALLMCDQL